ncbi:MAG: acetoin utilization protein AcuC [Candidatus Heimdallarchaeota archaeon]
MAELGQTLAYTYSDDYLKYNLGKYHPMGPMRVEVADMLVRCSPLSEQMRMFKPRQATHDELVTFHDPRYVKAVESVSATLEEAQVYGLGTMECPVFPELHTSASTIVGGILDATKRVVAEETALEFPILAGMHHAHAARADGFCYYNDIVIALKYALDHGVKRILFLDTDVHHPNGVQEAFYANSSVLLVSLHLSSKFIEPATGEINEIGEEDGVGFNVNLPFYPSTRDSAYLEAFEKIVPPLWEAFDPELVVWECGADTHFADPIGELLLTTTSFAGLGRRVRELSEELPKGMILAAGGGYNPEATARCWTVLLAGLLGVTLPEVCPTEWNEFVKLRFNIRSSETYHDRLLKPADPDRAAIVKEKNDKYLATLLETISPYFPF